MPYGGGDIKEVNEYMPNGNYGGYVCDIAVFEKSVVENEVEIKKECERARLKYLDVIRNYSFVQEQIRNGVFVKKYKIKDVSCKGDNYIESEKVEIRWKDAFEELTYTPTYDFQPLDISLFTKEEDYYVYNEPLDGNELSVDKIKKHNDFANSENKFAILLPNYDEVIKYNEWWIKSWGEYLEFFSGYTENTQNADFKFCVDVDKYILGRVEVIFTGNTESVIPKYVFYTELKDRIDSEKDGEFLDYLKSINPIWQSKDIELDTRDQNFYIKYVAPEITLETIINAEEESEGLYVPYEYSIINGIKERVVNEYTVDEKYSGLTPIYVTFNEGTTIVVESQLQSLVHPKAQQVHRGIFGVFQEFEDEKGQLFKCTFVSGKTSDLKPKNKDAYICYSACTAINNSNEGEATEDVYCWWECVKENNIKGLRCADGEDVDQNSTSGVYRNVTIVSCIKNLEPRAELGEMYYVLARYDNGMRGDGTIVPLKIPYLPDVPLNIATYSKTRTKYEVICNDNVIGMYDTRIEAKQNLQKGCKIKEVEITISGMTYDVIENITPNENGYIEIEYTKGKGCTIKKDENGKAEIVGIDNTGIRYKDTIRYIPNNFDIIPIDGVYPAELYYDTLDLEGSKKTIYSEEYNLKRKALRSEIVSMETGSQWAVEDAVNALLFTKEGSDGIKEEPKYDINLLYNRGNAAAWENHFKLSECNTLEDLENYGNNFFNL